MVYNHIKRILPNFKFEGVYRDAEELHSGNINNSYHLIYWDAACQRTREYVLQRINSFAFRDPRGVMTNISRVTDHLRNRLISNGINPERRVLSLINTCSGDILYEDIDGGVWRAYHYIDHAKAYDIGTKPKHFYEAGRAFGEFQKLLYDFPADSLNVTIPDFHNTTRRFYTFVAAVANDQAHRVSQLEDEIEFFFDHRRMMNGIMRRLDHHEIPLRVTHNDTKLNNVMIDTESDQAICVIDLDTVMPGSSLFDYGDAIRFTASTAAEDEPDTSKIALDMDKFEMYTKGFLSEANGFLLPEELKLLPLGVKVITCELAMRFLTDYIDGDLYFKVNSPEHNLVRAHAQMKLLTDIEAREKEMQAVVDKLISNG